MHSRDNLSPAFQVALDAALEGFAREPENKGFWWARCALGENGKIPNIEKKFPGIGEELLKTRGNMLPVKGSIISCKMRAIGPGTFMMGSPEGEANRYRCEKQHEVTLKKGFLMMEHHVTQRQWKEITGKNPSHFKKGYENAPVGNISWNKIQKFIRDLNAISGQKYRLPTEAEWEYAARGGEDYIYSGSNDFDEVGWHIGNSGERPHPVCQKRPNGYGLFDMSGNIAEWTQDPVSRYPGDFVSDFTYDENDIDIPRIVRGGGFRTDSSTLRVASRGGLAECCAEEYIGFRLVLDIE